MATTRFVVSRDLVEHLARVVAKIEREYQNSAPPGAPAQPSECSSEIETLVSLLDDEIPGWRHAEEWD
jgi:hypothetical protein